MPRPRAASTRSRRQRLAAGAVLAASGLLGTYLAAIRPQPTYASPNAGSSSQAFRSLLSPSALPAGCPVAPAGWDDTYVSTVDALRTAVTTADDSTFICITESLAFTGGQLQIDDTTLTIAGLDDSEVTIDLPVSTRFLDVYLGRSGYDTLTIQHLTIKNADYSGDGGAIRVDSNVASDGALVVESSRFIGNETSNGKGGAIWSDVPIELTDSHFNENRAANYNGGAIYVRQALEVNGSSFTGNYSGDSGGAINVRKTLAVDNSEFTANTAKNSGGAIYVKEIAAVSNSEFTGNSSSGSFAGAIFASDPITVRDSTFTGNSSPTSSAGAIWADDTADIFTSVFLDNYARSGGGAVRMGNTLLMEDCLFYGNDASSGRGAGLEIRGGSGVHVITSSSFILNGDDTAPSSGGGIYKETGDLVISNSLFWGNEATNGGAVNLGNRTYDDTITYTTIAYNEAVTSGGGIFVGDPDPNVDIQNSILYGNLAGTAGSDVLGNGADVTLRNSTYTDANSLSGVTVDPTSVAGDPLLPQPGNNGGPVIGSDDSATFLPTTIPGIGSPAIGRANPSLLPAVPVDQISATRTSRTAGAMNAPPNPTPPPPTPTFPPSAPLSVTGQAGSSSATVTWAPPSSAGSFPITDYQAVVAPGGQTCLVQAPATSCTITGLTNGTEYTAIVRALNGAGWGAWSDPSEPFTPVDPVAKSILITGTRAEIRGRSGVRALGETTGLEGAIVQSRVRLAGEVDYSDGSRRTVAQDGSFTWQRRTNKKVYVYFYDVEDPAVRSNRIVISMR